MSDLMTNAEVEDVLSSIRRLVSEEERVTATSAGGGNTPSADRLILTPAQLIAPVNDAVEPDAEENESDVDAASDAEDNTVFVLQEAQQKSDDDGDFDAGTPDDSLALDDEISDASNEDDVTVPENFEFNADEESDLQSELPESSLDEELSEEDVQSVFSDTDTDTDSLAVDDDNNRDSAETTDEDGLFEQESNLGNDVLDDADLGEEVSIEDEPTETDTAANSLGDKVATLETLIASRGDQWEPDTTGQSDYAAKEYPASGWSKDAFQGDETPDEEGSSAPIANASEETPEAEQSGDLARAVGDILTVQPSEDAAFVLEDEVRTEPMKLDAWNVSDEAPFEYVESEEETQTPPQAAAVAGAALSGLSHSNSEVFSADEDAMDEAVLREMIADIVREELQGALGERITRNVRKLVRREIHRALAAQDLD